MGECDRFGGQWDLAGLANSGDGGFDGLGMPDQTLAGPIHFKRRSEDGVTPAVPVRGPAASNLRAPARFRE